MADSERKNNVIKNTSSQLVYTLISSVLGFVSRKVFLMVLGENLLGLNGVMTSIIGMLNLAELGVGEALVSVLDEEGVPTIVERCKILPPQSLMGPVSEGEKERAYKDNTLYAKYKDTQDPDSAYEFLERMKSQREEAEKKEQESVAAQKEAEKQAALEAKEAEKAEKEAAKEEAAKKKKIKSAAGSVASSAAGTIGREVGKTLGGKVGGKYGKTLGGNIFAQLGRSIMGTFFK